MSPAPIARTINASRITDTQIPLMHSVHFLQPTPLHTIPYSRVHLTGFCASLSFYLRASSALLQTTGISPLSVSQLTVLAKAGGLGVLDMMRCCG